MALVKLLARIGPAAASFFMPLPGKPIAPDGGMLNIKTRVSLAFMLVLLLLVGVVYELHTLVDSMAASIEMTSEKDMATMAVAEGLQSSFLAQSRAVRDFAGSPSLRNLAALEAEHRTTTELLRRARGLARDGDSLAVVRNLRRLSVRHAAETRRYTVLRRRKGSSAADASRKRVEVNFDRAFRLSEQLMLQARAKALRHGKKGLQLAQRAHDVAVAASPSAVALALVLMILLVASINRPLRTMVKGVAAIRAGDLSVRTALNRQDELGEFSVALDDTLDHLANERRGLQRANERLREEHERAEEELRLARLVQAQLLREPQLESEQYRVTALLKPAGFVGGDFYQFSKRGPGVRIVVGDVAGKGVPAALTMAASLALFSDSSMDGRRPRQVLRAVNEALLGSIEMGPTPFVTALVLDWDPAGGRLVFATAGHPMPFLLGSSVGQLEGAGSLPLGLYLDVEFPEHEAVLRPGEQLVAFTDGITDVHQTNSARLDVEGLARTLADNIERKGPALLEALEGKLKSMDVDPEDDQTLVVLEALGPGLRRLGLPRVAASTSAKVAASASTGEPAPGSARRAWRARADRA